MSSFGVLHIPHSSAVVPPELRMSLRVADDVVRRELLAMTDWYTDELFALPPSEAATIRFPVSRLVLDPERFLDDQQEVMASRGMGVVYTCISDGGPLRDAPTPDERRALIRRFYEPHHASLTRAVRSALEEHGRCLVVDCHSFPSRHLPCDLDQTSDRPDICVGSDPFHTPNALIPLMTDLLAAAGLSVEINRPFSGALVPAEYYRRQPSVCAIMIEINRRLYIDEGSGAKLASFPEVAELIQGVLLRVFQWCRSRSAA